ncbi:MAG: hypothetical protein WBE13_03340 [Candidatus Acidiferrum sp.]
MSKPISRNLLQLAIVMLCLILFATSPGFAAPQSSQQQQEQEREREQQAEQERQRQEEQERERQAEQERQQQEEQQREQQAEQERQQQEEQQREQQAEQERQQRAEQQRQQQAAQQAEQQREQQAEQERQQQAEQRRQQQQQQQQQQRTEHSTERVQPAPHNGEQVRPGGSGTLQPVKSNPGTRNGGSYGYVPANGRPAANPAVAVRPVVVIPPASAEVLKAVSVAPNMPPGQGAANAQLLAAQQQVMQSQMFQNMIASQIAESNEIYQFRDAIATAIMQNTSDPAVADAMSQMIGQTDPIQDALNQQLQALSDLSASQSQARLAAAQAKLSAAQQGQGGGKPGQNGSGNSVNAGSETGGNQACASGESCAGVPDANGQQAEGQQESGQQGEAANQAQTQGQPQAQGSNGNSGGNSGQKAAPYAQPVNNCVSSFFDPTVYNWLSYQNNCSQEITVAFSAKNGTGIWGSMNLQPGQKGNTGWSNSEIRSEGGVDYYACPYTYVATDLNGKTIIAPAVSQFQCKWQGY